MAKKNSKEAAAGPKILRRTGDEVRPPAQDRIVLDLKNAFAPHCEGGLYEEEVEQSFARLEKIHQRIEKQRAQGELPFFNLPYQDATRTECERVAHDLRTKFDTLVVLGIGGSSLGTKAILGALKPDVVTGAVREGRVLVVDNVDPVWFASVLRTCEPAKTCFNVISKSGETAETAALMRAAEAWLRAAGRKPSEHWVVTTDPQSGSLREYVREHDLLNLWVPEGVGGRFSVLSPVGLLPAAFAGVDLAGLFAGAVMMDERCGVENYRKNPAYLNALVHYLFDTDVGRGVSVLMPYATGLKSFADWYVQLWAESLGKAEDLKGEEVNTGPLPVPAVGATDQHSQMQLFMEGPHDKVVTFVRVDEFAEDPKLPATDDETNAYLSGSTLGTLLNAEQRATAAALAERGRPNLTISLPDLSAKSLGQLFMMYEIQTVAAGALYGINPLDQPGVELGKRLTFALMGKAGYEAERAVVDERAKPVAKLLLR